MESARIRSEGRVMRLAFFYVAPVRGHSVDAYLAHGLRRGLDSTAPTGFSNDRSSMVNTISQTNCSADSFVLRS